MNKNIKIAKQLVKLAKSLVADQLDDGLFFGGQCPECHMSHGVIFMPGQQEGYCVVCGHPLYRSKDGKIYDGQKQIEDASKYKRMCTGLRFDCVCGNYQIQIDKNNWKQEQICPICGRRYQLDNHGYIDCDGKTYKSVMDIPKKRKIKQ